MHFCYNKNCSVLFCILMLLLNSSVPAQRKLYTLSELSDSLNNHLPVLFEGTALINSAKAAVTDTRHSFLPRVRAMDELNIGTDNSVAGSYFPVGIIPSTSAGIRADNNYQPATGNTGIIYGEYDLINFGLRYARIKNAEAFTDLQESGLAKELYTAKLSLAKLYFNLLKDEAVLAADKENVSRYENVFSVIRALTKSGIKPGADSSLSKAELSRARISYNQTIGNVNQIKEQLSYLTGINAGNIEIDTLALRKVMIKPGLFNQPVDTASNPLIDYYRKLNIIYSTNETVIRKSYLPKLVVTAGAWARGSSIIYNDNYKSLSTGFGYQRFNYAAGLAMVYDLFNGVHKRDKININRFQAEASQYELEQQTLALHSASLQADNAVHTTETNLLELPVQIDAAKNTYDQKLAQYKAGIINLVDLTNAAFVLYRSVNDYIETLSDWYLAQLDKAAATNNLGLFIQTIK